MKNQKREIKGLDYVAFPICCHFPNNQSVADTQCTV